MDTLCLGAAVLFLVSLLLGARLSINFAANLKEGVSNVLSMSVKSEGVAPTALTTDLLAAGC
jgi:hypothetical protein